MFSADPRSAMPFDWTFSSPAMVRDCLDDDFRAFLDPREYIAIGKRGRIDSGTRWKRQSLKDLQSRLERNSWPTLQRVSLFITTSMDVK